MDERSIEWNSMLFASQWKDIWNPLSSNREDVNLSATQRRGEGLIWIKLLWASARINEWLYVCGSRNRYHNSMYICSCSVSLLLSFLPLPPPFLPASQLQPPLFYFRSFFFPSSFRLDSPPFVRSFAYRLPMSFSSSWGVPRVLYAGGE